MCCYVKVRNMVCKECGKIFFQADELKRRLIPDICQDCADRIAKTPVSDILRELRFQKTLSQLIDDEKEGK